ncbi:MAG: hypothetical protein HC802_06045, partial [Caldilineaceae bacterium]|nr:hypothetical protein [Caldilineaceae bacterium]
MWKNMLLLFMVLLLSGCTPVTKAQSLTPTEAESATQVPEAAPDAAPDTALEEAWQEEQILDEFQTGEWLDVSLGPPLIEWYNDIARPNDIARVEHVSQVDLLDEVNVGRKLVIFKSASDAERLVPRLVSKIDIIGYNLEHGPTNPADEQASPVESAKRMRVLADKYGLELALGPDHGFALSDAAAMAPYVDIIVLQVQRAQTDHETVREFVLPLAQDIRAANPDIELSVQVRTEGDVVAITELIDSMRDELDGISILTSPETTDVAEALVEELRPAD